MKHFFHRANDFYMNTNFKHSTFAVRNKTLI